jgi:hypothetical protein
MTLAREILEASPAATDLGVEAVADAVGAWLAAAQACTSCADASLGEEEVETLRRCVALAHNCADLCTTTLRLLSRPFASDHLVTHRFLGPASGRARPVQGSATGMPLIIATAPSAPRPVVRVFRACTALLEAEAFTELEKLAGG